MAVRYTLLWLYIINEAYKIILDGSKKILLLKQNKYIKNINSMQMLFLNYKV